MKYISKTKARQLIIDNQGSIFGAQFVKKDGKERTINCQALKEQDSELGYIRVKDMTKVRKGDKDVIRNINLQTIKTLSIKGTKYKIS